MLLENIAYLLLKIALILRNHNLSALKLTQKKKCERARKILFHHSCSIRIHLGG